VTRRRGAGPRARAGRGPALVAVVMSVAALVGPAAAAQPASTTGSLALAYQQPWMGSGSDFAMRLRIGRPTAAGTYEILATVYPSVATRSEFAVTLGDKATASALTTQTFPLSSLLPDPDGAVPVVLHLSDRGLGKDDGVFPLRVELRERGAAKVLHRFTTHIVYLPTQHPGDKLGVSLVLPVSAAPGLPASGARKAQGLDRLVTTASALDAVRATPVALAPTPETLATLAASDDDRAATVLKTLQQRAPTATVLGASYVPTSLPALLAAGLVEDATTQLAKGASTVADVLHVRPDIRTWLAREPVDRASLGLLAGRGVERAVVAESDVQPLTGQRITLTSPFLLAAGDRQIPAVAADSGLSAYFDNALDPVLAANHLLADLAVIYLDRPGAAGRAVVAAGPTAWQANRSFLDTLVAGLSANPIAEAITLDAVFSPQGSGRPEQSRPLVRTAAAGQSAALSDLTPGLVTARRRLDALATVLGTANEVHATLEERLLLAESVELRTNRQRQAYLDAVLNGVDSARRDIRMPGAQSITLTARRGEIPVTFQNRTGLPARVVVKVQSDKLDFPRGSTATLDLARRNTTERFAVVSRTSGAFPLRIVLESPDGNLVIGQARLTVRSAAASGISLIVSLGAALFLAVWWGRHALRGRRARRLVPA
jgi:hypothetical protein